MHDMYGVIFCEQRSIATKIEFIEIPLIRLFVLIMPVFFI
jgi:hypothetical protein